MPLLTFPHQIDYPDNRDIPLAEIAATLLAQERFLPVVADLLQELTPGLSVESIDIRLEKLVSGSLTEAFFVAIFVAFQDDLEKEVPTILEAFIGHPIPDRYDTIVTVLFLIVLYACTRKLIDRAKKPKAAESHIENDYRTYVDITANTLNIHPLTIERAVEKTISPKRAASLARSVVDFFRPAKRGGNGRIIPRGLPPIRVESVEEFPNELVLVQLEKDTVPIPVSSALLEIRATDRDKADKGWGGRLIADGLRTSRLPLILSPSVEPDDLAIRSEATVEAVLENKITEDGRTKPYRIHVMRILD